MDTELAKLRELLEKSTQGKEFTPRLFDEAQAVVVVDQKRVIATFFGPEFVWNAHLFAALRNEFPAILTILEAERQERAKAEKELAESNERNHKTICSYCGLVQDKPEPWSKESCVEQILAHLENCPTHPMNLFYEAEARASRAEQATKSLLESCATYEAAVVNFESALAAERERVIEEAAKGLELQDMYLAADVVRALATGERTT